MERVQFDQYGDARGTIKVTATHPVSLRGYVLTSNGRVTTTVTQNVSFSNTQKIIVSASQFLQNIIQTTTVDSNSKTIVGRPDVKDAEPVELSAKSEVQLRGFGEQPRRRPPTSCRRRAASGLDQTKKRAASWSLLDTVTTSDTLTFKGGGFSPSNGKSRQQYKSLNLDGACYQKTLKSRNYVLTSTTKGC